MTTSSRHLLCYNKTTQENNKRKMKKREGVATLALGSQPKQGVARLRAVRQLLSLCFWFYKVIMLEAQMLLVKGRMQV